MNLKMICHPRSKSRLIDAVLYIVRHGLRRNQEHGRFIHIVPEPGYPLRDEIGIQRSPPFAGSLLGEIGKDCLAWPDHAHEGRTIRILDEMIDRKSTRLNSSHLGISY